MLLKIVPMSVLSVLAQLLALFARWLNTSIYRSICTNIMLVHPFLSAKERQTLAKKTLTHQLSSTLYSAKSWVMPPDWALTQIKTVHNIEILQKGLLYPKGLLIIAPHLGTWEMMNAWVSQFGKLTIMYKPSNHPKIDQLILEGRQKLGATLVPTNAQGVKAIFKTLKQGGFSVLLPDHVPDKNGGEVVPFFGIPTLTGTLAPKLIQKTNCAVVGLSCIKRRDDGFDIFCYEFDDTRLYDDDIITATTALNDSMQTMIHEHFSHYMWGYRRFKTTPFGENPYLLDFDELHDKVKHLKNTQPHGKSHGN